jgi:hypothetical protein
MKACTDPKHDTPCPEGCAACAEECPDSALIDVESCPIHGTLYVAGDGCRGCLEEPSPPRLT